MKYFKTLKLDQKYMKIDFSQMIFMDESRMTFDGPDVWTKRWIFSNSDVAVANGKQQRGGSVMIWLRIINQTVTGPFKIDEGVKLNMC